MKLYNISIINELENSLNIGLVELKKYNFPHTYSFAVGKIYIKTMNGAPIINIDENISKDYMNAWYSSIGKLFLHDIKTNNIDNYFSIQYDNVYYLLKMIDDSDKIYTKKNGIKDFDQLTINNNIYAIICASYNERFMSADFTASFKHTIIEKDEDEDTSDDIPSEYNSLELFNDDLFDNSWDD